MPTVSPIEVLNGAGEKIVFWVERNIRYSLHLLTFDGVKVQLVNLLKWVGIRS